jgi:hypothetical protein
MSMTHQPHNDLDILRPAIPRRRVLQSLVGATLALVGLAGCGGEDDDEEEEGQENEEEEDD